MEAAAARRDKAINSGLVTVIEEPMPNANTPESTPERQPLHRG
jgi:hypothetical protein